MDEHSPSSLMYDIGALKQELELRSASLLQAQRLAFLEMSLRQPTFSPSELGFYQVVSWLYCFYYEAGRVSFPFLLEHFSTYGLDNQNKFQEHYEHVRQLRTQLQHNLNLESSGDLQLQKHCENWYSRHCGSAIPGNDGEWKKCLISLLSESQDFLKLAIDCVRFVEKDESKERVVEQWLFQVRRHHPIYEFEKLVSITARDMGQEFLDATRICERYYDKWSKELRLRTGEYDFETEARKLIEHTLLTDAELPLPITGQDIIRQLGIQPGPSVGILLKKARNLYNNTPCTREALILRLAESEGLNILSPENKSGK